MPHETFHYRNLGEVREQAQALSAFVPLSEDLSALYAPLALGRKSAANRSRFTHGRNRRHGGRRARPPDRAPLRALRQGGSRPHLFEAVATVPEARASAHQLYLREDNLDAFARLNERIREICLKENGYEPVIVMQATNSGRYSKPNGFPEPLIAYNCPPLEDTPLPKERILSDGDLRRYEEAFEQTARLCARAGFDGMDVKCCHRYLACELLSAYTRPGPYGGSYENRTRFLKNAYRAARAGAGSGDFFLTSRLNVYDGFPYPYGFGVHEGSLRAGHGRAHPPHPRAEGRV